MVSSTNTPVPPSLNGSTREKLTDVAYRELEEAIVTLRIPPGTLVSEPTLCEMIGVGRTPLREAVQRLAREHLILIMPQRGLLIPNIDIGKQLRLLETRREIERLVCRSAAKRANENERKNFARLTAEFTEASLNNDAVAFMRSDREFNELCLVSARNEFAESALRSLNGLSRRFWYLHYQQSADLPEMARLHASVAAAIAAGNPVDAAAASNLLIDNIESFTKATVMLDQI